VSTGEEFEEGHGREEVGEDALVLDLDGFEGPIDLLLALARRQKVDLTRISITALADQYLAYIQRARHLRLEIAADYLVMAAWLAYLKSRLLLPDAEDDEPSGEEMAEALTYRLAQLEAMRKAGERLMRRDRLGLTVFARGEHEAPVSSEKLLFAVNLQDLLKAYADLCRQQTPPRLEVAPSRLHSIEAAVKRLSSLIVGCRDWKELAMFLPPEWGEELARRSAVASTFVASLELAREGRLLMRQDGQFGPIYLRETDGKP